MKLLILNYEYPPLGGGAGNATYYLLRELKRNEALEIDLITSSTGKFRTEQLTKNARGHFLDIGKRGNLHFQTNRELLAYTWKSFEYSKKLIEDKLPDLVHAFFGIPCGHVAMQLGLPYIVSLRGSDVPYYNKRFEIQDRLIFQTLSRSIWKRASAVVANSSGLKELALETRPCSDIDVIFNGVDTDEFRPDKKRKAGVRKNEKLRIISSGRLIERKGFEYLLKALARKPEFEVVLMGDGDKREELMEMASDLDVDARFLGAQQKAGVIENLQTADIFALPSLNEGMSNSILEAMACGLPIVSTDVGGNGELIEDGKNGFVVSTGNSQALSDALGKYSKNQRLVSEHGEESRRRALNFSWAEAARKYLDIYSRVTR